MINAFDECPSVETGCFASDQDAFNAYSKGDPEFHMVGMMALAEGATGIKIGDSAMIPPDFAGTNIRPILGSDEPVMVTPPGAESSDDAASESASAGNMRARVIACARACGAAGVHCPLLLPGSARPIDLG